MRTSLLAAQSLIAFVLLILIPESVLAQFAGSRGGVNQNSGHGQLIGSTVRSMPMSPQEVQGFIVVDGKAELRVAPTSIRIILAITSEKETAALAREEVELKISELRKELTEIGIETANIVEDFIAVLPRYKFELEHRDGGKASVEKRSGHILQTNLHILVKDDEQAMSALRVAFAKGVNDVIGFEYWNDQIEELKKKARELAVKAAKEKSDVLLAVFDKRPAIINIAEFSEVIQPDALYQAVVNSHDDTFYAPNNRANDVAVIRTFRPKNTYYRGFFSNGDYLPGTASMKSEISVVSSVNLYFESPVAQEYLQLKQPVK